MELVTERGATDGCKLWKTGLLMDHKSASGKLFLLSIWAGTFSDALTSYMPGSWMHNSFKVFESPCKEAGGCCSNCSLKL